MSEKENSNWRQQALEEFRARREALEKERRRLEEQKQILQQRLQEVMQNARVVDCEINDLEKAADTFGLLDEEYKIAFDGERESEIDTVSRDGLAVKDVALAALKEAYPSSLRATEIKDIVEQRLKKKIHAKTPGMTLYRLSRTGVVRNSGWNWFFVPSSDDK